MIALQIFIILALFAAAAFFSAAESALTALSAVRMKKLSVIQPGLARYLKDWLATPHRLLTTLMVGSNLVSVGLSSFMAVLVIPWELRVPRVVLETGVWATTTVLLLLGGEIVPKIIGRTYREWICAWTLPFLAGMSRGLYFLWAPVGWMVEKFTPELSRPPVGSLTELSLEELHHVIGESEAGGHVPKSSGEMMRRALSLSHKTVRDIMQPVKTVNLLPLEIMDGSGGLDLFIDLLVETGRTRVPVTLEGRPVGYLNALDLLKEAAEVDARRLKILLRPAVKVREDMNVSDLLVEFRRNGEPLALVMDAGQGFVGLVTQEDVLEEVVGEILDEYDLERPSS